MLNNVTEDVGNNYNFIEMVFIYDVIGRDVLAIVMVKSC